MIEKDSRDRTVLIVEDGEDARYFMRLELEQLGYLILEAENGEQAIDVALRERPDIILMDLNVPVINGWEATRQLKANAKTAQIPIIALTAHAMAGDRERALAAGCDDFDTKPIDFDRLPNKMRKLVGDQPSNP